MSPEQQALFRCALTKHWLTHPLEEVKFHPSRKWRFDYAWPDKMVALEVEGGVWTMGRHTRGIGFVRDMEKYNAATLLGWRVLRVPIADLQKESTFCMLADIFSQPRNGGNYSPWTSQNRQSAISAAQCQASKTTTPKRSTKLKKS